MGPSASATTDAFREFTPLSRASLPACVLYRDLAPICEREEFSALGLALDRLVGRHYLNAFIIAKISAMHC